MGRRNVGFLLLIISLFISSTGEAQNDWLDNIPWGTTPEFYGERIAFLNTTDNLSVYQKRNSKMASGAIKVDEWFYIFCNSRLAAVSIKLENRSDFDALFSVLYNKYGAPSTRLGPQEYQWIASGLLIHINKSIDHNLLIASIKYFETTPQQAVQEFQAQNVSRFQKNTYTDIIGEITNNTLGNYTIANFSMSLYSPDNILLDVVEFFIMNFQSGQTRSFSTTSYRSLPTELSYKIQFESGF